jgi:hypothetical protein
MAIHNYVVDISCTTAFILLLFTPGESRLRKCQAPMFTVVLLGAGFPVDFLLGSNRSKTGEDLPKDASRRTPTAPAKMCVQNPKLRIKLIVNLCNAYLIHCIRFFARERGTIELALDRIRSSS